MASDLEARLQALADRGVILVDSRQIYLDSSVRLDRVGSGAILHPGTRLVGARTCIGPHAEIGVEGPATLVNTVVGPNARVDAGFLDGAVLMPRSRAGFGCHFRAGTILEEQASTAHCVGLKHTILLAFVTLGSLINFCDVLMAGGTSRSDHSEVGSGFIHFNFTPWGKRGDKATPSLLGDVVHGVFLRSPRIFMGGVGGMVGPGQVGYGAITAAGQVVRKPVGDGRLVSQRPREFDVEHRATINATAVRAKIDRNVAYLAQLHALRRWYREVRLARIPRDPQLEFVRIVTHEAAHNLDLAVDERLLRLREFADESGEPIGALAFVEGPACPLAIEASAPYVDHLEWVRTLSEAEVARGAQWLAGVVRGVVSATAAS